MGILERDFHDSSSSFDDILDFDDQEFSEEPPPRPIEEKEDFYRPLDEY